MGIPIWYPQWWMNLGLMTEEWLTFHQFMTWGLLICMFMILVIFVGASGLTSSREIRASNGRGTLVVLSMMVVVLFIGAVPVIEIFTVVGAIWFAVWLITGIKNSVLAAFGRVD